MRSISFKPLSIYNIKSLNNVKQAFCDSYLVASLSALSRKKCGQKFIQNNVTKSAGNYKIKFNDVVGAKREIRISEREIGQLEYRKQHILGLKSDVILNRHLAAFELAMGKLIQKYPSQKPLIFRLIESDEIFEYNKASRFMKMFTGKEPFTLKSLAFNCLPSKKNKSLINTFFQVLGEKKEFAFVAGTGITSPFNPLKSFHCYPIRRVCLKTKKVILYDNKTNQEIALTFDKARKSLKYITGYFEKDLI